MPAARRTSRRTRLGTALLLLGTPLPLVAGAPGAAASTGPVASAARQGTVLARAAAPARFPYEAELRSYLARRPGSVAVSVRVPGAGRTYAYAKGSSSNVTASIVKVDVMATLLHQAQGARRALTAWERARLTAMITRSDNAAATALWNHVGGGPAVARFNRLVPMPATVPGPGGYWGLTRTTATDQVALLDRFASANALLGTSARSYGLGLMRRVVAGQRWGVTAGPPAGSVAVKNGWLPRSDGWHVNSDGYVASGRTRYVVSVLTSSASASEATQIATVQGVSRIVWRHQASGSGTSGRLPAPGYVDHVLARGATDSAQVAVLQTRLGQVGHPVGAVDGVFGSATDAAVRAYQSQHHLPADGVVGPTTGEALGIWR